MHEHPTPHQKTHQKSAPTSSGYGDLSNTPNSTAPTSEWVHEPEAATLLAIKQNTLRAMRRDGRLIPGDHDAGKDCEKHQPSPLLTDQATVTPLFR